MKVLITGGAGYVGTALCEQLLLDYPKQVEEIIVYDNLSRGNYNFFIGDSKLDQRVRFIHGDLLDSRTLQKSLQGVEAVVHLAAKVTTPFGEETPHLFEQVNHWGTAELVYALENSPVQKLIYLSSASVYGASDSEMTELQTPNPKTFYGISKLRGEDHVSRLFSSKKTHIIRCGNIFGYSKSMRFDSVINKFVFDGHFKKRITIDGSGSQKRSFIHIDRVADALSALLVATQPSGISNLVDSTLEVNEVADALKKQIPDMEMLYVNQNLKLRELVIRPNSDIQDLMRKEKQTLDQYLGGFLARLAF